MDDPVVDGRVEVVKHGPLYRANVWVLVGCDSPYRSAFASGYAIKTAWADYPEVAARRVALKARRVKAFDKQWREKKRARTTYYDQEKLK